MAETSKPDYTYLWSSGGAVVAPSNVKIQTGWTAEVPPFQWENWSQNRQDVALSHILQKGISVWSSTGEYYFTTSGERSYVQGTDGNIYVALADSVGQNPVTDTTNIYWKLAFSDNSQLPYRNFIAFTTPGTTTWTCPAGVFKMWVEVYAGGGGGGVLAAPNGIAPSGGGGGGVAMKLLSVIPGTVYTLVVGAGGVGGVSSPSNGSAGGASNFNGTVSATGGLGGSSVFNGSLGLSGSGSGGDINYKIGTGSTAIVQPGGTFLGGAGGGGESPYAASDVNQPTQPGMGGGGRSTSAAPSGANGAIRIFY